VGDKSHIEWTDATWNPVTGCSKVSQGCRNCYALRDWARLSANPRSVYFGRAFTDVECHEDRLGIPLQWARPRRIFVNSMSDLFHAAVPDGFIRRVFETMTHAPQHTFQVLTKRADRMYTFFSGGPDLPINCHLGISVEDQLTWDERAPWLLGLEAAPVKFVSFEPLLGPIDCRGTQRWGSNVTVPPAADWPLSGIQWAIVGGESGPQARPMHPDWVRSLRNDCRLAGVPFFFKQWGEWLPGAQSPEPITFLPRTHRHDWEDGNSSYRVGKKIAGRWLDGFTHDGRPAESP
jgi:protein gp37